jgi:uncharacterized protein YbaR (Trm112 family)
MDAKLLEILVCPICKGRLIYRREARELICRADRLAYAITADDIPVLLAEDARALGEDELAALKGK